MKKKNNFYVTTPIYYPNDIPHIGSAYTTIAADILARWNKIQKKEVFFLTGTDEHGKKIELAAQDAKKKPKTFVDNLIPKFKEAWKKLNINYNRFIRTTDADHEQVVQVILSEVHKKGDIYEGYYEGLYCTGCEAYYTEKELLEGCCPVHKTPIEKLKEESYFFRLSKYKENLLNYYDKNPDFISPSNRRFEIINRVNEGLQDLSISRTSFSWGIPLPFDKNHICYVWFDALANYLTGIGYLEHSKEFQKFWPADVHIIGKDILWFHAVIWPAILFSLNLEPPKKIFAHGWWTVEGQKMSKSLKNIINIDKLISIAGVDSARYFLFREVSFGEDGDFSEKILIERHNNELANKLGNLISRVSTLAETYGMEKSTPIKIKPTLKKVNQLFQNLELDKVLNEIFSFIDSCNIYAQEKKPWETKNKKVIYSLCNAIKDIAILLSPFMPETSEKISKVFNFEISIESLNNDLKINKIKKSPILFKKINTIAENVNSKKKEKVNKSPIIDGIMSSIEFKDWEKLDIRVGKIEKVEEIDGADKLYKLSISVGAEKRTICAGLKKYYKKSELEGKKCIVFVNLAPRIMKGVESQGMLLAAVSQDEKKVIIISPEKDIEEGAKIR
ncbi:methionine--tRNA ligase [Candidatus Pacearchaeota archaeon]|nr:methionine--tRNA ligase [Candidatus Pacearchaeota archaeon]